MIEKILKLLKKQNKKQKPHLCMPKWVLEKEMYGGYGVAINECRDEDGCLWVGNGEYYSRVNYCPFCGVKAIKQIL